MPRTCTICTHDSRSAIDKALVRREPYRNIAKRFSVSQAALSRHLNDHLVPILAKATEAEEISEADRLRTELEGVKDDVERLKEKAEEDDDYRTALLGCDKALKALELQAKVLQVVKDSPTVNLYLSPEWLTLRTVIVAAIEPHPGARESVLRALEDASQNGGEWNGS